MLLEKGHKKAPSLRRHYPDQVYGYNLRLRPPPQTPRETLKILARRNPTGEKPGA